MAATKETIFSKTESGKIGTFYSYKGYSGTIEYDAEDKIYYGKLLYVRDLVNYHSKTFHGLYKSYMEAIEDYIAILKYVNKERYIEQGE